MRLGGLQSCSLVDYPGKVAATVFTQGCNLRCPWCHNRELVPVRAKPALRVEPAAFLTFLDGRKGRLEGVCVTGGEPTQHRDLEVLLLAIHARGLKAKLDTNGTRPEVLRGLLESGLVDFVAMDVKHRLEEEVYRDACGCAVDLDSIRRSIAILQEGRVAYEFRTTVVPGLHDTEDLVVMAREIQGAERYALQAFHASEKVPKRFNARAHEAQGIIFSARERVRRLVRNLEIRL